MIIRPGRIKRALLYQLSYELVPDTTSKLPQPELRLLALDGGWNEGWKNVPEAHQAIVARGDRLAPRLVLAEVHLSGNYGCWYRGNFFAAMGQLPMGDEAPHHTENEAFRAILMARKC